MHIKLKKKMIEKEEYKKYKATLTFLFLYDEQNPSKAITLFAFFFFQAFTLASVARYNNYV